jgi:biotin carboxyl carrier protein
MEHGPYNALVNGEFTYEHLDAHQLNAVQTGPNKYHVLHGAVSYHLEIIEAIHDEKKYAIKVNGSVYQVQLQDKYDQLVQQLGLNIKTVHRAKDLKSPMPGLIRRIDVVVGQPVNEGDALLVLEAMKMENILKSPGQGIVRKIHTDTGQAVDKGQLLIEIE